MLKIWGYSDDVVELGGSFVGSVDCVDTHVSFVIGDRLRVDAGYDTAVSGVWSFAISQAEEDVEILWPISIVAEHDYSLAVLIDCPPRQEIKCWLGNAPDDYKFLGDTS